MCDLLLRRDFALMIFLLLSVVFLSNIQYTFFSGIQLANKDLLEKDSNKRNVSKFLLKISFEKKTKNEMKLERK